MVRLGSHGESSPVLDGHGEFGLGKAVMARQGVERRVLDWSARLGSRGVERPVKARIVKVWHGPSRHDLVVRDGQGTAWQSRLVKARQRLDWPGLARQSRQGTASSCLFRLCGTCQRNAKTGGNGLRGGSIPPATQTKTYAGGEHGI